MKPLRLILAPLALLPTSMALAHSELPALDWCNAGTPIAVMSFNISPTALNDVKTRGNCPGGSGDGMATRSCGEFDDDYSAALRAAQDLCNGYSSVPADPQARGVIPYQGTTVPLVNSPATFLSRRHHLLYSIDQGLQGVCVRCAAPVAVPITPVPSN